MDFRYRNYYTIYKAKVTNKFDTITFETDGYVTKYCFYDVYCSFEYNSRTYKGTYSVKCMKEYTAPRNNYCFLTKKEIKTLLKYLEINYNITTQLEEDDTAYYITFNVIGKPVKHKWILAWSRAFYEFPFNFLAKDVFRLRKLKRYEDVYFANQDFFKLYTICVYSSNIGIERDSSLWKTTQCLIDKKTVKHNLTKSLKYVWDVIDTPKRSSLPMFDAVYQNFDELTNDRISIYCSNYKLIKE